MAFNISVVVLLSFFCHVTVMYHGEYPVLFIFLFVVCCYHFALIVLLYINFVYMHFRDRAKLKWWYKLAILPEDRYPKQLFNQQWNIKPRRGRQRIVWSRMVDDLFSY